MCVISFFVSVCHMFAERQRIGNEEKPIFAPPLEHAACQAIIKRLAVYIEYF